MRELPSIERFTEKLINRIADTMPSRTMRSQIDAVIRHRDVLSPKQQRRLVSALRGTAKRFDQFADRVEEASDGAAADQQPMRALERDLLV